MNALRVMLLNLLLISLAVDKAFAAREDAAIGACCGSWMLLIIIWFVVNIAILVWVAKDAKSRGMGSAVGWVFLVIILGIIGLIIYLCSRPSGDLVQCEHCNNRKLRAARLCPHCGHEADPFGTKPPQAKHEHNVNIAIPSPQERPAQATQLEQTKPQFCTGCGTKVSKDDAFCSECGTPLP
jgi:hypothetical protein